MRESRVPAFLGVFLLFCCFGTPELQAQGGRPGVQPRRDLAFGDVFAGLPKTISPLDPSNSGMYRIQGRRNTEIMLSFSLPINLVSVQGQTLTVDFVFGDAGFSQDQDQAGATPFDPNVPFTVRLNPDGRAYVWLGGTSRPTSGQQASYYEADVVLTATYTGN